MWLPFLCCCLWHLPDEQVCACLPCISKLPGAGAAGAAAGVKPCPDRLACIIFHLN